MTISLDDNLERLEQDLGVKSYTLVSKSVMFASMLDLDRGYLRRCETLIKQHGDTLKNKTNLISPMTDWCYIIDEPHFHPLLDAIAKKFESVIDPEAMAQLELTQCWGAYYNKTDHAIRHDHKEAEWSFVYYINADKGSSTFDIHEHYEPFDAAEVTLKLEVETNKLIFFRGHVQHSVSPQKSDGERVCIAGNLQVRKPW